MLLRMNIEEGDWLALDVPLLPYEFYFVHNNSDPFASVHVYKF